MKKTIFINCCILFACYVHAQRVGIGTANPQALLHVQDSSVLFTGRNGIGDFGLPPVSGPGSRLMWYANASAFRAGRVSGNHWDMDSTGRYSVAMGNNTKAIGGSSVALGNGSEARGGTSFAMGLDTRALGTWSTAFGSNTEASGNWSSAFGNFTTASATNSTAMGRLSVASGDQSFATGEETIASGTRSTAMGFRTDAGSTASTTLGYGTIARGYACTAVGYYNTSITIDLQPSITSTSPLFIVGNGEGPFERKNAFVVLKNGNVGIGSNNPRENLTIASQADPIVQFQRMGFDIGFIQTVGNHFRIGTNSSNDIGNLVFRTNGADRFTILPNGNATMTGTLTQNSDSRLKMNITPLNNALEKINALSGYRYQWKPGLKRDSSMQIGLIAQEVEAVLPELVTNDAEGNKSVAYQNMIAVLVEAVKEQQQMINALKKQVRELQKK